MLGGRGPAGYPIFPLPVECLVNRWCLTNNWWMSEWMNHPGNLEFGGKMKTMGKWITENPDVVPTASRPQALAPTLCCISWRWHSGPWEDKVIFLLTPQGGECLKKETMVTYVEMFLRSGRKKSKDWDLSVDLATEGYGESDTKEFQRVEVSESRLQGS